MARFAYESAEAQVAQPRAQLLKSGVGRGTLRGKYERSSRGFYRPARGRVATAASADDVARMSTTQRILDAQAVMPPGALISGWAAAYVRGVDVLDGLDDHTMAPLPVPVLLPPGLHRKNTGGIGYRQTKRPIRGEVVNDVAITLPYRTAFDLARSAPDLTEAVVCLDAFLAVRLMTLADLRRNAERLGSQRGARQGRRAVELALPGVRSSWESRLRMFGVLELGLVGLEASRAVFDRAGNLLGVPDLLDAEAALAIEYDGARWRSSRAHGHRDREQHREDNAREERLERAGLIVVRAEKSDLTEHRRRLGERIRSAHRDGLERDRARDRWTLEEPEDWFGLPA